MGFRLYHVPSKLRYNWIKKKYSKTNIVYMGDGIFDQYIMKNFFYSIAPNNSYFKTKKNANFVTKSKSGERAVAEACEHILNKFFKKKII